MRNVTRIGAAAATLAAAGLAVSAAPAASAATVEPAKHHHAAPATPPPPVGEIVVCNHSGYMFNVYADGPSLREDDLAGSFDECTNWDKVLTGGYKIGFGLRAPSQQNILIQARFKRNDHVFYKVFSGQGVMDAFVNKAETLRIDLFIPRA